MRQLNNDKVITMRTAKQPVNVSKRYSPIQTNEVVSHFESLGWYVRNIDYAKTRDKSQEGTQKHIIRMSHDRLHLKQLGLRPEVLIKNSYNGTSSFVLSLGVYREVCSNGLEVGETYKRFRVRHVGRVLPKVEEAIEGIVAQIDTLQSQIDKMQAYQLTPYLKQVLAIRAFKRLSSKTRFISDNTINQLLQVRRDEDSQNDTFTVLNVIQENIVKHGYQYDTYQLDKETDVEILKTRRSKPVSSFTSVSKVNALLWDAAVELLEVS